MTDDKRFVAEVQPGNQFRTSAPGYRHPGDDRRRRNHGYLSLRSDIQQMRADLTVKVRQHELRIATIEHAIEDQHREGREFQAEMPSAISRVTDILNDVRIQLGHRLPRG
jgi:hypothetical protein